MIQNIFVKSTLIFVLASQQPFFLYLDLYHIDKSYKENVIVSNVISCLQNASIEGSLEIHCRVWFAQGWLRNFKLQTWAPHLGIAFLKAVNEKCTIFDQFCSNLQRLTHPWCGQSLKVWAKSGKNYGFFINSIEGWNFTLGCPGL